MSERKLNPYWTIWCGNFMGCRTFATKLEAEEKADLLTAISGLKWEARVIYG